MANVGSSRETTMALATAADGKNLVMMVPRFPDATQFTPLKNRCSLRLSAPAVDGARARIA
jgi:hypothetical protein